ncbi:polymer-forming cytoskeletal protein [Snodgrassella alvi]|uniref:polymer-forming cytoskeletal protein n=1 Tax=Snodgrassella alvi TaxID=1196083 RepID=UPI000996F73A|nr:polymer-forming cytoskeletal protein [Snodgrassella alvi]OOX78507.1 hypothetical protein BGH94_07600 [Snodgrassella alvi]ORF00731.1 hypothetical protein BGH95_07960 [Snodgrassella alvi]
MEAKEEEFIVTRKWLEKIGTCEAEIQAFEQHFPNGGEALEVLKRCEELGYRDSGEWLVDHLPPIYPPLELNTLIDSLFYPNDVHIKGDVSIQGFIHIKGSLKVDGKLTVKKYGEVYSGKDCVNADEIDLSGDAYIHARIKANRIDMRGEAIISGDTKAKVVNLDGGRIYGNVDADELYNDGGYISQNAKADKATLINGGNIGGNITFKCLSTDSNFYAQIFRAS